MSVWTGISGWSWWERMHFQTEGGITLKWKQTIHWKLQHFITSVIAYGLRCIFDLVLMGLCWFSCFCCIASDLCFCLLFASFSCFILKVYFHGCFQNHLQKSIQYVLHNGLCCYVRCHHKNYSHCDWLPLKWRTALWNIVSMQGILASCTPEIFTK